MATKRASPPAVIDPNQRYSLAEAFAILRISPAQGFKNIKGNPPKLQTFTEGSRRFVHGSELIRCSAPPTQAGRVSARSAA